MPGTAVRRWVGSGYVPGRFGAWGFSGPVVVVEIAGSRVTVRLRPKFLASGLGVAPLIAEPSSGLAITTRRVRMGWGWLIDFRLPGGRLYSLIINKPGQVLSCLSEAGFEVAAAESGRGSR